MNERQDIVELLVEFKDLAGKFRERYADRHDEQIEAYAEKIREIMNLQNCDISLAVYTLIRDEEITDEFKRQMVVTAAAGMQ